MARTHTYRLALEWTGNTGTGTSGYRAYSRDHLLTAPGVPGRPALPGSADPAFRGDPARWNPEELLVASLSQCHLLWYLHLASQAGVVVLAYQDAPSGTMAEQDDGAGAFVEVTLHPAVTVAEPGMCDRAQALHADVGRYCFIARSVAFPVHHRPTVLVAGQATRPGTG